VIVVVEGPSGAGKTTWCRTRGRSYALLEELPDHSTVPSEPEAQARFWVERNVARWRQVMGGYALADLYLVSDIDEATLRARREADKARTRRDFERHVLLRDSLLRWYRAIGELEPGRVRFGLPETGLTPNLLGIGPRQVRSGAELFERLLARLDSPKASQVSPSESVCC
jgi:hypothetical protein